MQKTSLKGIAVERNIKRALERDWFRFLFCCSSLAIIETFLNSVSLGGIFPSTLFAPVVLQLCTKSVSMRVSRETMLVHRWVGTRLAKR